MLLLCLKGMANDVVLKDSLDSANAAFARGDYQKSFRLYNTIIEEGNFKNPDLYYNRGVAAYRKGELGSAIWSFEKCLLLDPGHEDAQYNLSLARELITDRIEPIPDFMLKRIYKGLLFSFSTNGWAWMLFAFAWLSVLGFLGFYWMPQSLLRKGLLLVSAVSFVLMLLSAVLSYQSYRERHIQQEAIVMSPNVYVKSAPEEGSADIFVIHEGLKVSYDEQIEQWIRISLPDGKVGWLKEDQIKKL